MRKRLLTVPILILIFVAIGISAVSAAILLGGGGASNEEVNLQKGLMGHWKFDGNAKDSTPYANNGTLAGEAAVTATDRKGQVNKALALDGTGDYVNVGNNSSVNITGNLTLGFWVNFNSLTNYQEFVGKFGGIDGADTAYEFRKTSAAAGNNLQFCHGNGTSEPCVASTGALSSTGTWYNIVLTRSGTAIAFYINGVLDSSTTLAGTVPGTTGNAWLGERNDGSYPLDGKLDDVRVYNRALSATEVTALYNEYDPGIQISDLQKGLVGQWKMDGNAKDATPYANNGTVTGATLTTDRKGQALKAYSFDGTDDYVDAGNNASLQNITTAVTVEAWVKRTAAAAWHSIVSKNTSSADRDSYRLLSDPTGIPAIDIFGNTAAGPAMTQDVWYHLVGTWDKNDGGTIRFYQDGVLKNTGTYTGNLDATTVNLSIGRDNNNALFFPGLIDDVRIYNRALSATEITALYQSYDPGIQVSDLQKGLVGHWKMDGNAKDSTPYGNNGTVTGAALTTDRKGQALKAYSFDGVDDKVVIPDSANLDFGASDDFSILAWANPIGTIGANPYTVVAKREWNTAGYSMQFQELNGRFYIRLRDAAGNVLDSTYIAGGNRLNTGFHFYSMVAKRSTNRLLGYIDGVEVINADSSIVTGSLANAYDLAVGMFPTDIYPFNGQIDDVRIYNRALSATEVLALYESY